MSASQQTLTLCWFTWHHRVVRPQHSLCQSTSPLKTPLLRIAVSPLTSPQVHSGVRERWLAGDEAVRETMEQVAQLAEEGRAALQAGDHAALASLMNKNFDLRR